MFNNIGAAAYLTEHPPESGGKEMLAVWRFRIDRINRFSICREEFALHHFSHRRFQEVIGNDELRFFHSGQVLYRSGNTAGDIELWRNGLTGCSDLTGMFDPFVVCVYLEFGFVQFQCSVITC